MTRAGRAPTVLVALALLGLLAPAFPVFLSLGEIADAVVLFATPVGLVSFAAFLARRFARGRISAASIALAGAALYCGVVIGAVIFYAQAI